MTKPSTATGDLVARQIRRYRQERGWSVRQLAEECARLGVKQLTQSSLANIERTDAADRGRREVTVDELLALAVALGVPPLALLLPIERDESVGAVASPDLIAVTPATEATWWSFASWLRGRPVALSAELADRYLPTGSMVIGLLFNMDRYEKAWKDEAEMYRRRLDIEVAPDSPPDLVRAARTMHHRSAYDVIDALRSLLQQGVEPPAPQPDGPLARIVELYGDGETLPVLPVEVADFLARHRRPGAEPKASQPKKGARRGR